MNEKIYPLNSAQIKALKDGFEILTFPSDFDLVYENQVPNAGIALIEGKVELIRNAKVEEVIQKGHLFGIHQLLAGTPVGLGCRVKANSKIILLGKSDLMNFSEDKKSQFHEFFETTKTG